MRTRPRKEARADADIPAGCRTTQVSLPLSSPYQGTHCGSREGVRESYNIPLQGCAQGYCKVGSRHYVANENGRRFNDPLSDNFRMSLQHGRPYLAFHA